MAYYNLKYTKDLKVHITKGNQKIGKSIYSFSVLPGYEYITSKDKGQLINIHGTCKGVCKHCEKEGCYAIRDAKRFHNTALKAWAENTLLMRNDLKGTMRQITEYINKNKNMKTLRWNVAGELENYEQLIALVKLAKDNPNIQIYFYTKRFDIIQKYIDCNKFPINLVCNISKWHDNIKEYNFDGLNIFAYDDGNDPEIKNWTHCPAVDKNGKETGITCDVCQRCTKQKGYKTAVYAH